MRRHFAWLGAAMLLLAPATAFAQAGSTVKPYIVFIMDTSGSMVDGSSSTGFGPPSCSSGAVDRRLDHAKCAVQNIANSYGDMIMALARFRLTRVNDNCESNNNNDPIVDCVFGGCTAGGGDGDDPQRFELLVPLVEDNQDEIVLWNDFTCSGCAKTTSNPEMFADGGTPLGGSLIGAKRYWQGNDPEWTSVAGGRPIHDDPLNNVFTSPGQQCRPYITILMTDGDESCANFNDVVVPAASSLLTTTVNIGGTNRNYRIETKPIGFGKTPGDPEIEALAHAGGAVNDMNPATHEGAYAQNEEELQLEISQIIADALKFEQCNNLDDDCDTRIDEDFPQRGGVCDDGELGVCRDTGTLICNTAGTGVTCNVVDSDPPIPPSDGCNNQDDDCDGRVDENCNPGCGDVELCDNVDNDCDMRVDENLTRPCGTDIGECTAGTETCRAGMWENCTAIGPTPEQCDTQDDDCDTLVDEQSPGTGGPCMDSQTCEGRLVCAGGAIVCQGPPKPPEICNNIDDDCDTRTDEGFVPRVCGNGCAAGMTACRAGVIVCEASQTPMPEVCNGADDDCDTRIDEGTSTDADCTEPGVCNGRLRCVNGREQCVGTTPGTEICDCEDNDCDTRVDENVTCGVGEQCVFCQCAGECDANEFPCGDRQFCERSMGEPGFCLLDRCFGGDGRPVMCPPGPSGELQECLPLDGSCRPVCDDPDQCDPGEICVPTTGECKEDNCIGFPERCTPDQVCVAGVCVGNPCAGVTCPNPGEYCQGGTCHGSCADVMCSTGQTCELGVCVADPCGGPCPNRQECNPSTGQCLPCRPDCPQGQVCDVTTGGCKQDPCAGVICPGDQVCDNGSCFARPVPPPDAGVSDARPVEYVAPGGGGGCSTGGGGGAGAALLILALVAARTRRARRAEVAS